MSTRGTGAIVDVLLALNALALSLGVPVAAQRSPQPHAAIVDPQTLVDRADTLTPPRPSAKAPPLVHALTPSYLFHVTPLSVH